MKKRAGLVIFLFLILILNFGLMSALTDDEENSKVNKAYDCLINKIDNTDCSRLSTAETIFSFLAVNKCHDQVVSNSNNMECWPKANCDLKTTAQAVLAFSSQDYTSETEKAEQWLIGQNTTPTNLIWYLEIDSNSATTCTIKYGAGTYSFSIDENKKIDKNAGNCLTRTQNNNWFEINKNCVKNEFQISCNKDFISTLLFKKQTSNTIYVVQEVHSAAASGTTIEQISAACFAKGAICDYEGSLWAAAVLNKKGYDISKFLPYLIGEAEGNDEYLPESFLYILTGAVDYKTMILQKQIMGKYWLAATDKYYDTAFALYPFQLEILDEKSATKEWLLTEVQQPDGCWNNGNVVDNAFILHSIWPRPSANFTNFSNGNYDCVDSGFFCMSSANCAIGKVDYSYDCPGVQVCCKEEFVQTCSGSELDGIICNSNQYCSGGQDFYTNDIETGEVCCVDGTCITINSGNDVNECGDNNGVCGEVCESGYEETSLYECPISGDKCCKIISSAINPTTKKGKWWIWVLLVLIVLVLIGIALREKLKILLIKMKSGKKKGSSSGSGPGPAEFPNYPRPTMPGPRRIIPSQGQRMPARGPPPKSSKELDDVLKKLKDMSK